VPLRGEVSESVSRSKSYTVEDKFIPAIISLYPRSLRFFVICLNNSKKHWRKEIKKLKWCKKIFI